MSSGRSWLSSLEQTRTTSDKSWSVTLILSIFLGFLGVDRMYLGSIGLGVVKMLTGGGYLVWWIVDIVLLLQGNMRDSLGRNVRRQG